MTRWFDCCLLVNGDSVRAFFSCAYFSGRECVLRAIRRRLGEPGLWEAFRLYSRWHGGFVISFDRYLALPVMAGLMGTAKRSECTSSRPRWSRWQVNAVQRF